MWSENVPGDPKIIKNRSGRVGKPYGALSSRTNFADHRFLGGPGRQQSNLEVPAGTLKSTKNRSLANRGVPGSDVLLVFVANVVFRDFGVDCSSIFDETLMKKSTQIFKAACAFFNMAMG